MSHHPWQVGEDFPIDVVLEWSTLLSVSPQPCVVCRQLIPQNELCWNYILASHWDIKTKE